MKFSTLPMKWLRHPWPIPREQPATSNKVAIAIVNFNTVEMVAHLLFSIYRILGTAAVARVVVVDNASQDLSKPLLTCLHEAGLIHAIFNKKQRYHGPALNQAMNTLAAFAKGAKTSAESFEYVWILDSDTIVLRQDTMTDAIAFMRDKRAGAIGEKKEHKDFEEGYAHVSSLLLDPRLVWQRRIDPFEESGAPAKSLQLSCIKKGIPICHFPFRSANYILHLGCGTLRAIKDGSDIDNRYYGWAATHHEHRFGGNPQGQQLYEQFLRIFDSEVPHLTPDELVAAYRKTNLIQLMTEGVSL